MDSLIRFGFNGRVRGQVVRLDKSWLPIVTHHQRYGERDVPPTVRERLGELTAAGLLLASSLKFDGSLLLQIQGTGTRTALRGRVPGRRALPWPR